MVDACQILAETLRDRRWAEGQPRVSTLAQILPAVLATYDLEGDVAVRREPVGEFGKDEG